MGACSISSDYAMLRLCLTASSRNNHNTLQCHPDQYSSSPLPQVGQAHSGRLTFIISTTVFNAIIAMMVYSKDGETTKCQTRYWKVCRFWGMYRVRGLALMAKSIQAL